MVDVSMPDAQEPVDQGVANEPAQDAGAPAEPTTENLVTKDELQKVLADSKAANGRLVKMIQDLQGTIQSANDSTEVQTLDADVPPSVKAERTKLKKAEAALAAEREKIQLAAVRTKMAGELQAQGVNPALVDLAVDGMISRHRSGVKVETGPLGETQFTIDTGTEVVGVTDFVSEFMKSDKGQALLLPKSAPNLPAGNGGSVGSKKQVSLSQAASMDWSKHDPNQYEVVDD